jgi:hypothetical protein
MGDEELAHKHRQHDNWQAPEAKIVMVNTMIDLVEVRVTPRDHLPVGHAGAPKREAVENLLLRSTETGGRCSFIL